MKFPDTGPLWLAALISTAVIAAVGAVACGPAVMLTDGKAQAARLTAEDLPGSGIAGTLDDESTPRSDSIVVRNIDGNDFIVMKAVRDDDGNMVANQVLEAATVTARFRNVAERHGRVDLAFAVTVPGSLIDSRWQLRYRPTMFILNDSLSLDCIHITGKDYRRYQLRGYQHYMRFLDSIIRDSTLFIRKEALEIFLRRNIPQIYAYKTDSSYVSEEEFNSAFGVSQKEALDHYTRKKAKSRNERKKELAPSMMNKYIKVPIVSDGIRLDSIVTSPSSDITYHYVQTIQTRPHLRKVEIVLDGSVYEKENKICDVARSAPLSFYISSVSSLVDERERYVTKIIERRSQASMSYSIAFRKGKWAFEAHLGRNGEIMNEIKGNCSALLDNEVFCLDSIFICAGASPEGSERINLQLSESRSREISRIIRDFIKHKTDSIKASQGAVIDFAALSPSATVTAPDIKAGHTGEDWSGLDALVNEDVGMNDDSRREYFSLAMVRPYDTRELLMSTKKWYPHLRNDLYPKLRRVNFTFNLHRRSMVKDTIHTTILDSTYMSGISAIKDRDYARAIEILRPYNDYNTAVAYCAKDFNHSALAILSKMEKTASVNYLLALLYSRIGDEGAAVEHYMTSCRQNGKFVHRGNLDPEISYLIKKYNINTQTK